MTDHERAVIMAYTGYAMLADPRITEELQKAAKADFVALCMDQEGK